MGPAWQNTRSPVEPNTLNHSFTHRHPVTDRERTRIAAALAGRNTGMDQALKHRRIVLRWRCYILVKAPPRMLSPSGRARALDNAPGVM